MKAYRLAPLVLLAAACGSNVASSPEGSAGGASSSSSAGTGGATASTTGGAGGASTSSTATGSGGAATTTTTATGSGGASTTTTTTTTTTGGPCGGKGGKPCASDEYCDYPDDICGAADGPGTCTKRPQACPDIYTPTCACDGTVYGSACDAAAAGVDVSLLGACPPPNPGQFPCGSGFCEAAQYCQHSLSDVAGQPDTYACQPLPAGCNGAGSCACVDASFCGGTCDASTGGVVITCPGG